MLLITDPTIKNPLIQLTRLPWDEGIPNFTAVSTRVTGRQHLFNPHISLRLLSLVPYLRGVRGDVTYSLALVILHISDESEGECFYGWSKTVSSSFPVTTSFLTSKGDNHQARNSLIMTVDYELLLLYYQSNSTSSSVSCTACNRGLAKRLQHHWKLMLGVLSLVLIYTVFAVYGSQGTFGESVEGFEQINPLELSHELRLEGEISSQDRPRPAPVSVIISIGKINFPTSKDVTINFQLNLTGEENREYIFTRNGMNALRYPLSFRFGKQVIEYGMDDCPVSILCVMLCQLLCLSITPL